MGTEAGDCSQYDPVVIKVSFRTAKATQRDSVSKRIKPNESKIRFPLL